MAGLWLLLACPFGHMSLLISIRHMNPGQVSATFNLGDTELNLFLVVALLLFGDKKPPEPARGLAVESKCIRRRLVALRKRCKSRMLYRVFIRHK